MSKGSGQGSIFKGILVLVVMLICAGGFGFAVGYTQQFAPMKKVAPTTAAATSDSTTAATDPNAKPALKKTYWISTKGWERPGYSIKVQINGNEVGTFQTPDRITEITKFVNLGNNKVRFIATALPAGNRNDYSGAYLTININQGDKFSSSGYKNAEKLVEWTRKVTETDNFDEVQEFSIIE
jgi:hypothetical protein